jgi:hypothetical protein
MLRRRRRRRHDATLERLPDPVVDHWPDSADGPEAEAITAESVRLALLVVLDELSTVERVAFVLHDVFAVPYDQIAPLVQRTTETTRQLASRARRRVRRHAVASDRVLAAREVVEAFIAAARAGDASGSCCSCTPTCSSGPTSERESTRSRCAATVARTAAAFAPNRHQQVGIINGGPGIVTTDARGRVVSVMAILIASQQIVGITVLADTDRLQRFSAIDR